jgi:hypothetical protein
MTIDGIEVRSNPVNFLGMKFMMPSELFISTRQPEDGLSVEVVD